MWLSQVTALGVSPQEPSTVLLGFDTALGRIVHTPKSPGLCLSVSHLSFTEDARDAPPCLAFYWSFRDPNPGPHPCEASILPTEPAPLITWDQFLTRKINK